MPKKYLIIPILSLLLSGCLVRPPTSTNTKSPPANTSNTAASTAAAPSTPATNNNAENAFDPNRQNRVYTSPENVSDKSPEPKTNIKSEDTNTATLSTSQNSASTSIESISTFSDNTSKISHPIAIFDETKTPVKDQFHKSQSFFPILPSTKPTTSKQTTVETQSTKTNSNSTFQKNVKITRITDNETADYTPSISGNNLVWYNKYDIPNGNQIKIIWQNLDENIKRRLGSKIRQDDDAASPNLILFPFINQNYLVWSDINEQTHSNLFYFLDFKKTTPQLIPFSDVNVISLDNQNNLYLSSDLAVPGKMNFITFNLSSQQKTKSEFILPNKDYFYTTIGIVDGNIYFLEIAPDSTGRLISFNCKTQDIKIIDELGKTIDSKTKAIYKVPFQIHNREILMLNHDATNQSSSITIYNLDTKKSETIKDNLKASLMEQENNNTHGAIRNAQFNDDFVTWQVIYADNKSENDIFVLNRHNSLVKRVLENQDIKLTWDAPNSTNYLDGNHLVFTGYQGAYDEQSKNAEVYMAEF